MKPSAARVTTSSTWRGLDVGQRRKPVLVSGYSPQGDRVTLSTYRGRQAVVLAFLHGPRCPACQALLSLWSQEAGTYRALESVVVTVVPEVSDALAANVVTILDPAGEQRRRLTEVIPHLPTDGVVVLVLDRYLAAWAMWQGPEAAAEAIHTGALEWLHFIALECPE